MYGPLYTIMLFPHPDTKPPGQNVTRKGQSSKRTNRAIAKHARNSIHAVKQRLQDHYVMHCRIRLHMDKQHPHYLKQAIAKQTRRCIKRSNGYLERKAYRIYRNTTVRHISPTPSAHADPPRTANFQELHDGEAAVTPCPIEAAPCNPPINYEIAPKDPYSQHETQHPTAVTCQDGVIHPQTVPNAPSRKRQQLGKSTCHHNTCCNPKCEGHCQNFKALCPEGLNRPETRSTHEQLHGLAQHQMQLAGCQQ